ncbi:general secretion pathway protein GspK [Burkholderia sp. WAC0059]|nr:general secretion pathway protein GspK [Burkholderia sp. WAC0059]
MAGGRRQKGIAVITALLVVALAASLAVSIVWRELVALRDIENQRLALQTLWLERAAVQWARATLRVQSTQSNVSYVGQAWSVPVRNLRLADLLPEDTQRLNGELSQATLSGEVEDAQAKFNLTDLISRSGPGQPWAVDASGLYTYRQLLTELSLNPGLAQQTAAYMLNSVNDRIPQGEYSEDDHPSLLGWPMQLVSIADLDRVPGYDTQTIRTLAPYVTLLPDYTYVNANTAPDVVLAAALPGLSVEQAHTLTARRQTAYFVSTGDIPLILAPNAGSTTLPTGSLISVNSGYFIVHCRIHSTRIDIRMDTLIGRFGIGDFTTTRVLWVHRLTAGQT